MTGNILASCLLLVATAAAQEPKATVQLNGGLEAQLLTLGRNSKGPRPVLTAAVKITNKGQDNVFLLLFGPISVVDDAGGRFDSVDDVTGVAYCPGPSTAPPSTRLCVGVPRVEDENLFSLQGYTQIEPGKSIRVNFALRAMGGSTGERVSLSAEMAYRLVKEADLAKDGDVPDKQKLKSIRFSTLSFEPVAVNEK